MITGLNVNSWFVNYLSRPDANVANISSIQGGFNSSYTTVKLFFQIKFSGRTDWL